MLITEWEINSHLIQTEGNYLEYKKCGKQVKLEIDHIQARARPDPRTQSALHELSNE